MVALGKIQVASNRTYRENTQTSGKDERYTYDNLDRLKESYRGDLNANKDGMTTTNFRRDWTLEALGNWKQNRTDANAADPWDATQARTHNAANEMTQIGGVSTHLTHDSAGNMTKAPKPGDEANHHHNCTYDAWNRLVKVADDAGTPATIAEYQYNGEIGEIGDANLFSPSLPIIPINISVNRQFVNRKIG